MVAEDEEAFSRGKDERPQRPLVLPPGVGWPARQDSHAEAAPDLLVSRPGWLEIVMTALDVTRDADVDGRDPRPDRPPRVGTPRSSGP